MIAHDKDLLRVRHILDAIETLNRHLEGVSEEDFVGNELLTNLVAMQITIIGEALAALSEDFRKAYPDLPYRNAKDMRNYVIHEYFDVSYHVLWQAYEEDLPKLQGTLLPLV